VTVDLASLQAAAEGGEASAQFAYSQALAAQKRLEESAVWLRRSAEAGHPLAQCVAGGRLLMGETTAETWGRGVDLIISAHRAGLADASNMLAGIVGMGAQSEPVWTQALDLLQVAAERGSKRGRAQLSALAREHGAAVAPDDWAGLRAAVTLEPWLQSTPPEVLSNAPHIAVYRNFVSPALCGWMIERAKGRVSRALVFDTATGKGRVERDRNNSAFQINAIEFDLMIALTRARITAATGAGQDRMEPPQILNYQAGETFAPHFDFLDETLPGLALDVAQRGQRAMTFLIYLNDDFDGGETDFSEIGLRFRGRTGDAILFHNLDASGAPDRRTRHAGLPPARGQKWLFSQWIRDRTPNAGA
jgi:hypothetical protein